MIVACSACFTGNEATGWAWMVATLGMLLPALGSVGAFVWWLRRAMA